ncbi:MAG: heparin lyase I family protein [Verrucomicrobia bacterium]|nr:heparin lyase I family protein [Verrucomicrobiota bacterium]
MKNTLPLSLLTFALTLGVGTSRAPAAELTFANGFESGDVAAFAPSGNSPTATTANVKSGKYAGSFELTRRMPTSYRTEMVIPSPGSANSGPGDLIYGREYWLGFSYRYEDWPRDSDMESAPFQVHLRPSAWGAEFQLGAAYSTAPFLMVVKDDEARFVTNGGKILWSAPVQLKQWLNLVVHFRISSGADGFIEVWKDGVKLGRVDGKNSAAADRAGNPFRPAYLKFGIYKWNWKEGRRDTQSQRRHLLIDDIKIATGPDGYALVDPAGGPSPAAPSATPSRAK